MTERLIGETGRRRRRRFLFLPLLVVAFTSLFVIAGAQAVHDEDFQLDGDVLSSTTTSAGGTTQGVDWDAIFNANGTTKSTLPTGFADAKLTKDFNNNGATFLTSDTSTFATGSKDTLPIADWQCNFDNNVNSKIDVMNAYSTSYQIGTGDEFMYFALERNTNTGDANVGFWFLQDEVGCTSTGGAVDFVGEHRDGDILVVSEFSNGGAVSTIQVYRWDDPDPTDEDPGSLNPDAIGEGVDCRTPTTLPDDNACAAANTTANGVNGTITVPWLTSNFKDKVGNKLRTAEFFEGGVNLTDLNLGGKCFNTFIGDTRSSTSLTATLFDFSRRHARRVWCVCNDDAIAVHPGSRIGCADHGPGGHLGYRRGRIRTDADRNDDVLPLRTESGDCRRAVLQAPAHRSEPPLRWVPVTRSWPDMRVRRLRTQPR